MDNVKYYHYVKYSMLAVSGVLAMVGSGGMAMILWIGDKADAMSVAEEPSSAGMHVLIACGILLVITGTLSFAGAYRRNQTVVCASTILLIVVTLSSTISGLWLFAEASRTDAMSTERIRQIVRLHYGSDVAKTSLMDIVHQQFRCCGSDSYSSWAQSAYSRSATGSGGASFVIPDSCCVQMFTDRCDVSRRVHNDSDAVDEGAIFTQGCLDKLEASSFPYGIYVLAMTIAWTTCELVAVSIFILYYRLLGSMSDAMP